MVICSKKGAYTMRKEITLSKKEEKELSHIIRGGEHKARKITRSRILLLAHEGKTDKQIQEALKVSKGTIVQIKKRHKEGGLNNALEEKARPGAPLKFNGKQRAKITAIACSTPPEGRARWSLRLLADHLVELKIVESIDHDTVSEILKKTNSNRT